MDWAQKAAMSSPRSQRKSIGRTEYTRAYKIGQELYREKITISEAGRVLKEEGMNYSSATDLVMGLRHLLKGERYTRTISEAATDDFLSWILRDYGIGALGNALHSVVKHLHYYEGQFSKRPGLHRVLDKHRRIFEHQSERKMGLDLFLSPEEGPSNEELREGGSKTINVNVYERSRKARDACIEKYGPICAVCGFDFERTFGELGKGFIHVHHLKNLASIGKDYVVDPESDLRPVCPNCHAMIHYGSKSYGLERLEEIRGLIAAAKTAG